MTFRLQVDGERWSKHVDGRLAQVAIASGNAAVPVVKGGGYGLGQNLLLGQVEQRHLPWVAVGTIYEATRDFRGTGRLIVLEPFDPRDHAAAAAWQSCEEARQALRLAPFTRTIANIEGLREICRLSEHLPQGASIIIEAQTSMRRFGFDAGALLEAVSDPVTRAGIRSGRLTIEGLSLHLPIAQPGDDITPRETSEPLSAKVRQTLRWAGIWQAELESPAGLWVSHCTDEELLEISGALPGLPLRQRVGTSLWLGDRRALQARATVLAVTHLPRGASVGYRQRKRARDGYVLTVSGGTWHGIGLQAPSPASTVRQRAIAAGTGALDATGRALSPFTWQGRQLWFVESPHQHVSQLWLPGNTTPPVVGDELDADVRFTTTQFDQVDGLN